MRSTAIADLESSRRSQRTAIVPGPNSPVGDRWLACRSDLEWQAGKPSNEVACHIGVEPIAARVASFWQHAPRHWKRSAVGGPTVCTNLPCMCSPAVCRRRQYPQKKRHRAMMKRRRMAGSCQRRASAWAPAATQPVMINTTARCATWMNPGADRQLAEDSNGPPRCNQSGPDGRSRRRQCSGVSPTTSSVVATRRPEAHPRGKIPQEQVIAE